MLVFFKMKCDDFATNKGLTWPVRWVYKQYSLYNNPLKLKLEQYHYTYLYTQFKKSLYEDMPGTLS